MIKQKTVSMRRICIKKLQWALGLSVLSGLFLIQNSFAGGVQTLDTVEVTDSAEGLVGSADSSTEGRVTPKQIEERPILRTGEVLETVPGVVISQHSGSGKANQYYLRGFNLDHGTDFATSVNGMPVNMPTHGHGQGYTDLNFLIPELIDGVQYKKGPYYAEEGDFSAAGAVHMDYKTMLERNFAEMSVGTDGYRRALVAASQAVGSGHLLYGLEVFHDDGPWAHPDDFQKLNGVIRYSRGGAQNRYSITLMAYDGEWDATDQVARRAVESGLIGRFGSLDTSNGGESYRYSLMGEWQRTGENSVTKANAYVSAYNMDLFSNFTYFLEDPVNGDQFEQVDKRIVSGLKASRTWFGSLGDHELDNTFGLQVRRDDIDEVGLHKTNDRVRLSTVRQDEVTQSSYAVYFQNGFRWAEKVRSIAGVRTDFYQWDVTSDTPANSGTADDSITSPKLGFIFGPWADTEFYLNGGYGFHSNDGRGSTITVDPATGDPAAKVDPLVRAKGAEIGARTAVISHVQSQLTFWTLEIDSELLFVGDAGATEASRPSRRDGIEWANYYTPTEWFTFDLDLAYSKSRFKDGDPAGDRIPGAPEGVATAGATVHFPKGFLGSVRLRYFGPRPLVEDNSVRSESSTLVNARVGYVFYENWRIVLDVFNVFDAKDSDVDYFYESSLPAIDGVGGSAEDIHTHPVNPRQFRVALTATF